MGQYRIGESASRTSLSRGPRLYPIGDVAERLGLSADTLRYYEKIGLLPEVGRNGAGIRLYNDQDLSRLAFIRRAQRMDFTLAEIGELLKMRAAPHKARKHVRELTARKLAEVEARLAELKTLRDELTLLLNLCRGTPQGCPIIRRIEKSSGARFVPVSTRGGGRREAGSSSASRGP
jgi:DNA-binding transcriptional MerR regulator